MLSQNQCIEILILTLDRIFFLPCVSYQLSWNHRLDHRIISSRGTARVHLFQSSSQIRIHIKVRSHFRFESGCLGDFQLNFEHLSVQIQRTVSTPTFLSHKQSFQLHFIIIKGVYLKKIMEQWMIGT